MAKLGLSRPNPLLVQSEVTRFGGDAYHLVAVVRRVSLVIDMPET